MDKKYKNILGFVFIYLVICIIKWIMPDELVAEVKNTIEYEVEKMIIDIVSSGNMKSVKYYESPYTDIETIYDVMGKSMGYLEYVKNENNSIHIQVYDPNIMMQDDYNEMLGTNETDNNVSDNEIADEDVSDNEIADEDVSDKSTTDEEVTEVGNKPAGTGMIYSMEQLSDFNFLMNNMYVVTKRANLYKSDLVAEELLGIDLSIKKNSESPQILIYHTHSHEGFVDTTGSHTSDIVAVGEYLAKVLSEQYGYKVIHCTESFDEVNGVFDRSKAYTYATPAIEKILENNPTIEVILDIHRDGLPDDSPKLVTTINGKQTAKIMFFNGISRNDNGEISYLKNPNRRENLAMSFQMKLKAMELYPEFTRMNYIDAYMYNLHLRPRAMLLEVGAQNNTFEEAKNAMEPFADILDEILSTPLN